MRSNIIEKIIDDHMATIGSLKRQELLEKISLAAEKISESMLNGGKLFIFGNGGSAADSQHIAAEFINRFALERGPLPAIALTTDTSVITSIANDVCFSRIFEKQVEALVTNRDVVLCISTSGKSENVILGLKRAKAKGALTVALTSEGGKLGKIADIAICVSSGKTARIQEAHMLIGHILCELVERKIFKSRP